MTTLRPYQEDIVLQINREFEAGTKRLLVVMPTGPGKTVVFSQITKDHNIGGTLIISHRTEIIDQTCAKLDALGLHYGVIQAGKDKKFRPLANMQVASIQTLYGRAIRGSSMLRPRADLIILDECHHATALTYQKVLKMYPNARVLGFTATPCRGDGRGLGGIFDKLLDDPQIPDLIDLAFLVPSVVYSKRVDLTGVRTVAGDYNAGQLEQRMDTDALVGDVVTEWLKHGGNRPTVVFASGVAHTTHRRRVPGEQ
jgi:DNA repair protein RadD